AEERVQPNPLSLPVCRCQQAHAPMRGVAPGTIRSAIPPYLDFPIRVGTAAQRYTRIPDAQGGIPAPFAGIPQVALAIFEFLGCGCHKDSVRTLMHITAWYAQFPTQARLGLINA